MTSINQGERRFLCESGESSSRQTVKPFVSAAIAVFLSLVSSSAFSADSVFARFQKAAEAFTPQAELIAWDTTSELANFRGKMVLVHFWAMWCAPCVTELPKLDALQRRRGGEDFAVVAISADRSSPDRLRTFVADLGIENLTAYQDRLGVLSSLFEVRSFPTSFLLDRDGRILGRLEHSADWNSPEADAFLDSWKGS